jgi:hypothetical protein
MMMFNMIKIPGILSGCHSSAQQPRQPDGGPVGQIKGLPLTTHLLKKRRAERQLFAEAQKGQKAARQRKSITV